ncbi:hypothetical protein Hanom_Chr04g00378841 [Helianthus anomalus]
MGVSWLESSLNHLCIALVVEVVERQTFLDYKLRHFIPNHIEIVVENISAITCHGSLTTNLLLFQRLAKRFFDVLLQRGVCGFGVKT